MFTTLLIMIYCCFKKIKRKEKVINSLSWKYKKRDYELVVYAVQTTVEKISIVIS